jgi:hypothetical protein
MAQNEKARRGEDRPGKKQGLLALPCGENW